MTGQAGKLYEEQLGLAGLSMDALAVVEGMAERLKDTAHHVPDGEILLRAVLLQSGAASDHGLKVIEPVRFSERMQAMARAGVDESICARTTSRLLGAEVARALFPSALDA